MTKKPNVPRRTAIKSIATGAAAFALSTNVYSNKKEQSMEALPLKGNINHSVCQWCFGNLPLETLAASAKKMGMMGIDLLGPKQWPILKKYNLESTMCNGAEISLTEGWNDPQYHNTLVENYMKHIDLVAAAGYTNLICFSGNRGEIDDETGLNNAALGLKRIMSHAEKKGVIIQMELLNSKIDHKDYMCDKSAWGIALCDRIGSANFKLLYDIYHMQIDEGDVIRTITDYHDYFGHYHTAGVPGRNEIDDTQELFYPAIMRAIVDSGFKGVVAQEFIPVNRENGGMDMLEKAMRICDV